MNRFRNVKDCIDTVYQPSEKNGAPRFITADTALRLSRYFGTSDRFWLNLQTRYDLETRKDVIGADLNQIRPLQTA